MAALGTRLYLGLDAAAVTAASLGGGLGGRRVRAFARVALEGGALTPSPSGPNIQRPEEVRAAVRRALETLGVGPATLVLPDGVARIVLLGLPRGADARDYARFRLAASLPWRESEAVVDVLPAGGGRVVGGAVRRGTVAEYEELVTAVGVEVERVHLAPFLALEGLLRSGAANAVHVLVGDVAYCLAARDESSLVALRSRRRDRSRGEATRLGEEANRTSSLAGNGAGPVRLVVSGADARRLRRELGSGAADSGLDGPAEWPGAEETAWLGGLVA